MQWQQRGARTSVAERPPRRIRVLIADDNPLVLEQVAASVGLECDVVALATNGREAVELALARAPEVVVLDISMPIMSGLRAAERLRQAGCCVPVVFLTVHEDEDFLRAALAVSAAGYVLKSRMTTDLPRAIAAAVEGRSLISPPMAQW